MLRAGYLVLAQKLQEAALSDGDKRSRLEDTLRDVFRGTGKWSYIVAVFGDAKTGDVIYSCEDNLCKAAYTISDSKCTIDTTAAKDVFPITTYHEEGVDVAEAGARHSRGDMKQLQGIHDASISLGAACPMSEAARPGAPAALRLVESGAAFCAEVQLTEAARTNYPIRIITPGTGTTAHYPAKVLESEAAKGKFQPGLLMFWNHPTQAEEAARPEGNLDDLAAITTTLGKWDPVGPISPKTGMPMGAGVYAESKVMADYAEKVQERAPHIGLSIRAGGQRDGDKLVEGKPVLASFDYIESVDYVTKAGRGGLALAEAARDAGILTEEAAQMTAEETKIAIAEAVRLATAPLIEANRKSAAREECARLMEGSGLPVVARTRVIERAVSTIPVTAEGALDLAKLRETLVAESKTEGEYIASLNPGAGRPYGMGVAPVTRKPEEIAATEAQEKAAEAMDLNILESLMGGYEGGSEIGKRAAKFAAQGRPN